MRVSSLLQKSTSLLRLVWPLDRVEGFQSRILGILGGLKNGALIHKELSGHGRAWIHKYRTTWAFHKTHAMPVCALPAFPQLVSRSKDREIWRKQQWKCGKKVHLPLRSLRPHWPSTWGLQLFCLGPSFFWNELTTTLRQHSPCHVEAWYLWFGDWAKLLELFEGQQLSIIQHRKCCPTDWFLLPARTSQTLMFSPGRVPFQLHSVRTLYWSWSNCPWTWKCKRKVCVELYHIFGTKKRCTWAPNVYNSVVY